MPAAYPGNTATKPARAKAGGGFESAIESAAAQGVINGTAFGAKTGSFQIFEDFESIALGGFSTPSIGENLKAGQIAGLSVESTARDGNKCIVNDYSTDNGDDFPKLHKILSGTSRKGYMGCWIKREIYGATVNGTPVWKLGRLNCNVLYNGDPQISSEYVGESSLTRAGGLFNDNGVALGTSLSVDNLTQFPVNTWVFYEIEYDLGTPGGTDCFVEVRFDGVVVLAWYGADGITPLLSGSTNIPDFFITPLNGMGRGYPIRLWMDDLYIDETRARVVMTDSAAYANATKWAVQPISSYADTEVRFTPKRQDFAIGETAYLHLFDSTGALVKSTGAITVEAD